MAVGTITNCNFSKQQVPVERTKLESSVCSQTDAQLKRTPRSYSEWRGRGELHSSAASQRSTNARRSPGLGIPRLAASAAIAGIGVQQRRSNGLGTDRTFDPRDAGPVGRPNSVCRRRALGPVVRLCAVKPAVRHGIYRSNTVLSCFARRQRFPQALLAPNITCTLEHLMVAAA